MKFTRTLASVAAAALAVSSLAIGASAAVFKATVEENGAPASNKWELKYDESVYEWAPNVTKVVATITNEAYVNGALGGNVINADGTSGWAASAQCESAAAGTSEWVWDGLNGLASGMVTNEETGETSESGYFKVEIWWMNAVENEDKSTAPATTFIDKVEFFDKDGKSLAAYTTPTDPTAEVTTSRAGKLNVGLEAQFDSTVGTIGEWPSLPKTTFRDTGKDMTITYDFWQYGPVKFGGNYVAIQTDLPWEDYDNNTNLYNADNVKVSSIKLDGKEYGDLTKLAVNNEGGGLRITLMNEWNDNFKNGNAPLSGVELPSFTKFEITFSVGEPNGAEKPDEPTVNPDEPTVNPDEPTVGPTEDPKEPGDCTGIVPGDCTGEPVNPPTGAAVAVIPAALAAAAVATTGIVLKKRSK